MKQDLTGGLLNNGYKSNRQFSNPVDQNPGGENLCHMKGTRREMIRNAVNLAINQWKAQYRGILRQLPTDGESSHRYWYYIKK